MKMIIKRCPKCGCEEFIVNAHVVQAWKVDNAGEYMETLNDCDEVAHFPDNCDIWECFNCGYEAEGEAFETEIKI